MVTRLQTILSAAVLMLSDPCASDGIVVPAAADDILPVLGGGISAVDEHIGVVRDLLPNGK